MKSLFRTIYISIAIVFAFSFLVSVTSPVLAAHNMSSDMLHVSGGQIICGDECIPMSHDFDCLEHCLKKVSDLHGEQTALPNLFEINDLVFENDFHLFLIDHDNHFSVPPPPNISDIAAELILHTKKRE